MSKSVKFTTPIGTLMWVNVSNKGKLNYNRDGYEYVASIVLSPENSKIVIDQIKSIYDENHVKGNAQQTLGYTPCTAKGSTKANTPEDEKLLGEGYNLFRFKTQTTYPGGELKVINIYNAKARKVAMGETFIGNGSTGSISGSIGFYVNGRKDGISLWLNSVQVINLVPYHSDGDFKSTDGNFDCFSADEFVSDDDEDVNL